MRSFWDLCTERRFENGQIPVSCMREYGYALGLDDDTVDMFKTLLRAMDMAYLDNVAKDLERQRNKS